MYIKVYHLLFLILLDVCLQIIDVNIIEDENTNLELKNSSKNHANKLKNGLNDLLNLNMIHHPSPISITDTPQISHHTHKLSKDNIDITVDYPYNEREIFERKQTKVSYATLSAPSSVSSYTIRNPPPIPSKFPASSPCSTPSATPPPPPPPDATPSSSHQYTLPDTPNYQPPPPDTPSSYQETPAPPPPDTPSSYQNTPAPPPPDTPLYNEYKIPDTPNTCQNTPAPPPPPDHHG